ncbi:COQ9 family protein [Alkalilacustris brevis]|uniref:COQ9 family protein n=1 Tax=Alkalilacustris brevis TaxID=2026338 RepID=UPI000E0D9F74|nr:COQ9 family protein [Alkalilacustris brevis]
MPDRSDHSDPSAQKEALLDAILPHVAFDGWSQAAFRAAIADSGVPAPVAHMLCPRGAVDLALAWHERGDRVMLERLAATDLGALRIRDRIALAVRLRIEAAEDREAVRRGVTLFALPPYAADGARAIWNTADRIWNALGDTSDDINWYSKRSILSGVYSSTVLYWLGDQSAGYQATWAFLDRRIEDVMRFEKVKGAVNSNPLFRTVFAGPLWAVGKVRPPRRAPDDMPGRRGDR